MLSEFLFSLFFILMGGSTFITTKYYSFYFSLYNYLYQYYSFYLSSTHEINNFTVLHYQIINQKCTTHE